MRLIWMIDLSMLISASTASPELITRGRIVRKKPELVFGIELTAEGATCAARLPNGQIRGLAAVTGSERHVELMHTWHDISLNASVQPNTDDCFPVDEYPRASLERREEVREQWEEHHQTSWKDWLSDKLGWSSKSTENLFALDCYQGDEATSILTTTMIELRNAARTALANETDLSNTERPYAEIALPGWLFKRRPTFAAWANENDPSGVNETHVTSSLLSAFTERISVAVQRAGFRHCADMSPEWTTNYYVRGDQFGEPPAAPVLAIEEALSLPEDVESATGLADTTSDLETCIQQRRNRPVAMAAIDRQKRQNGEMITFWVDWLSNAPLDPSSWRSESLLVSAPDADNTLLQAMDSMTSNITDVFSKNAAANRTLALLFSGELWTEQHGRVVRDSLHQHNISYQLSRTQDQPYLAAIGAAKLARDVLENRFVFDLECSDEHIEHMKNQLLEKEREL